MKSAAAETGHHPWIPELPGQEPPQPPAVAPDEGGRSRGAESREESESPDSAALSAPWCAFAALAPAASARWQFPAQPVHARMARIWLEAWIADRGLDEEACYCAAVAFSELVTNAVLHGVGPVTVAVAIAPGRIECEVSDAARDLPVVCQAGDDDEHHRGLSLVDALTAQWRVRQHPDGGKVVAFVIEV
ncbi:ATP-binding protein [Actinocrinis puniceicyclus]|uniref:ATP-binding protein n=1 Tax=Actinocrinis puniceicyclus TaxID=977794 RepID=A0A8J7WKI7_9ACTN|nr:ATP-binding protein [Actinocrinis puniceicyclus]MBS2963988.1 ATP-binding protein [Actinocrinis puniceicyclus]